MAEDVSLRVTGTLGKHCARQADILGQSGAEFVRACVRLRLKSMGIDWRTDPDTGRRADLEEEPPDKPASKELPGQQQLPPPVGRPDFEAARRAIEENEKVQAGAQEIRESFADAIGASAERDPFDE